MISYDERREVAQSLRNTEINPHFGSINGIPLGCIGASFAMIVSPNETEMKFARDRLADLIDPEGADDGNGD